MEAIIIAIGDEILNGQTIDTNSSYISIKLAQIGVRVIGFMAISDNLEVIKESITDAHKKADIVITTGGLGPTKDDRTKDALCSLFSVRLKQDKAVEENLHIILRNKPNALELNALQAFIPENAFAMVNKKGTAPGLRFLENGKHLFVMPGVPYEMRYLTDIHIIPFLKETISDAKIDYRYIMVYNVPESVISYEISKFEDSLPENISLSYLPDLNLVKLRLSFYNATDIVIDETYRTLINSLNSNYFFTLGDANLAVQLGNKLKQKELSLGLAESCTGGYLSHLITLVPGSSEYYKGGLVSYAYDVKNTLLKVSTDQMIKDGAVSEETVTQMATEVNNLLETDCGIAISGIAGPGGGTHDKPVGTVWIAANYKGKVIAKKHLFSGDRGQVIKRSSRNGMIQLLKMIED